ncbi:uncharacterized protein VTP21DRAFT_4981 [Calcarisporiella thermophila]|uniref:uncharacterized protein n=1 Tax=Calcarisporiella thermophila TaxID=911321 RepID=UPI0037426F94
MSNSLTVDETKLASLCREIIRSGDPNTLTARRIRREIEKRLGLDSFALDEHPWKKKTNELINAIFEEHTLHDVNESALVNELSSANKKETTGENALLTPQSRSKQRSQNDIHGKALPQADVIIDSDVNDESEGERLIMSKRKKRKRTIQDEEDESGDDEPDEEREKNQKIEFMVNDSQHELKNGDKELVKSGDNALNPSSSKKKVETTHGKKDKYKGKTKIVKEGEKSNPQLEDEELSEIEDIPVRSRKSKEKKKGAGEKEQSTNKDEESIKRLKGYINKCGVRKIWSKELAGIESPRSQIKKLKQMLADLGIEGTNQKCKKIREMRELQAEREALNIENVIEESINEKRGVRSRRQKPFTDNESKSENTSVGLDFSFLGDQGSTDESD